MNKHIYLLITLFTLLGLRAQGQCPTSVQFFSSQDSINGFPTNYPNCHTIDSLIIEGNDITSLAPLSQITSVTGNVHIQNCDQLPNLNGLHNIQSIEKELLLFENDLITNLDGLNNLQNITGSLNIVVNKQLTSLTGLSNLTNVGHILSIVDNDNLISLAGLEGVQNIEYGLIIGGNNQITNLSGLDNISGIQNGPLIIAENYNLTSISELSQLTYINDSLDIRLNTKLASLNGLQNVTSIGGKVKIEETDITDLTGLSKITAVHDSLIIKGNDKLTSLQGMTALDSVDHLLIAYCPQLASISALGTISNFNGSIQLLENGITNLNGLEGITKVHGDLAINYNGKLTSFDGLENITSIDGFLAIRNDTLLSDISALSNLDSVLGDFLFIANNNNLPSLSGIDNLFYIGGSAIDIFNNPSLSTCGVPSICYHISYANFINIHDNAPGCNNSSEVASTCGGPVIQGRVYYDANNDCQIDDTNEQPLANWPIIATQGTDTLYDYTDQWGGYKIFTPSPGTYTVTSIPPPYWTETCTGSQDVTLSNDQDVEVVDFLGKADTICPTLTVDITNGHLAPNKPTQFKVNYCNNGTQDVENAQIEVHFSDAVSINSSPIPYTDIGNNTFLFYIGYIPVGHCDNFLILGAIAQNVIDQQAICATATISPHDFCAPPPSNWSKASIEIKGECATDSIRFTIKNTGTGNMLAEQNYDIIIDDWVMLRTGVQLDAGETIPLAFPKSDSTYILRVPQTPNHPGDSHPLVAIEGCTQNTSTTFSTGHVLQFPEDDNDLFISIDCQEVNTAAPSTNQQNFPKGYGSAHFITKDQPIEYKVNFHNTSQDTLRNMVIKEAISPYLDLTTLQLGASSDPYDLSINNDTLVFHLSNMTMAPADTNYAASFGFVKFKLTPKPNLANGTVITNTASLHYGPTMPVETNEVFNTIGKNFVLVEITSAPHYIHLNASPNPFFEQTTFDFDGIHFHSAQINIFNASGQLVQHQNFQSKPFTIYKNDLPQGQYTFEIIFDKNTRATGKITIL